MRSMRVNVKGKLAVIEDTHEVGSSTKFNKRRCVVYSGKGPIPIDFMYDTVALLDEYEVGDQVAIFCILEGREWTKPGTDKKQYFLSLRGVSITRQ